MSTTKRLRTKDEELTYKRLMAKAADNIIGKGQYGIEGVGVTLARLTEIAKMVSDDIKRMAKVPL